MRPGIAELGRRICDHVCRACSFGRWLEGNAVAQYGKSVDYKAIGDLHERCHELAAQALELAREAQADAAQECLHRLLEVAPQI